MAICIVSFSSTVYKNQTKVNGLTFLYVICFAMSIIVDCLRIFVIFGAEADYPDLDFLGFIIKCTTIFLAFALISEIHILLSEHVGEAKKYFLFLRYYLFSLVLIFTGVGIFWSFITIPTSEFNFHLYQIEFPIYMLMFLAYFPVGLFVFFRQLAILRSVNNKKIRFRLSIFTILTFILIGERSYSMGFYAVANSFMGLPIEVSLLLDFLVLTVISCLFLIMIFKYHGLMESMGSYFTLKKLYILKNNGVLMFEYDFENKQFLDSLDSTDPIIGGFIYAICEGLKDILKSEKITSFSSGNRSLIIQRGKYLITVLVVTEDSISFHRKSLQFLKLYETYYRNELEDWIGAITLFNRDTIQKWIIETLCES